MLNQLQAPSRLNSMNTFDGTRQAHLNDRSMFERSFVQYCAKQMFSPPPLIAGIQLDVFILFHYVFQLGGFEEVDDFDFFLIVLG